MKNLSRIFLRIGAIFGIIYAASFLLVTLMFAIFASPAFKDVLVEGFANGTAHSSFEGTPQAQAEAVQIMFLIMAISFGVGGAVEVASTVFSFRAIKQPNETSLILAIVFGAISATSFPVAGGILGLINDGKEKRRSEKLTEE